MKSNLKQAIVRLALWRIMPPEVATRLINALGLRHE